MRKLLIAAATMSALAGLAGTTAVAGYKGPHPVMQYGGNEYAVVINRSGGGRSLVVYRAVGSLWERIGGTTVKSGQNASNGSLIQNVWFRGRKIRTVRGDLRKPFYRHYNNVGTMDY